MVDDSTSGIYRWTIDALFGTRLSPSKKFRDFSNDDTNYSIKNPKVHSWDNEPLDLNKARSRSNSLDIDRSLQFKYDLLPDDDEPDLLKPVNILPRESLPGYDPTLPGKFPINHPSIGMIKNKNYTDDYIKLIDRLSLNNKQLLDLKNDLQIRQDENELKEATFREKYLHMRNELINELKHSKSMYDNYCNLFSKYKKLKSQTKDNQLLKSRISQLENQIMELTIENEQNSVKWKQYSFKMDLKQKQMENNFELEKLKYESQIQELETLMKVNNKSSSLNTTIDSNVKIPSTSPPPILSNTKYF